MLNKKTIAEKITELRKKNNLSRQDCANACGVSLSAWQMYENGERVPRDQVKIAIADFFGLPVGEIFFS